MFEDCVILLAKGKRKFTFNLEYKRPPRNSAWIKAEKLSLKMSDILHLQKWLCLYTMIAEGNGNLLQYSCLENPHGQRRLAGCSPRGCKESDTTEWLSSCSIHSDSFAFIPTQLHEVLTSSKDSCNSEILLFNKNPCKITN